MSAVGGAHEVQDGPVVRARSDSRGNMNVRVRGYDVIRGIAVLSMVAFHECYDLVYLKGASLPWFESPLQDIWRASISWTFLVLAGIMCSYSRSNLRRGLKYLAVAAVIYLVTSIAAVDAPISFGIIYCMGFSTLFAWVIGKLGLRTSSPTMALFCSVVLFLAFIVCLGVPSGSLGLAPFGGPSVRMPVAPYATGMLSWLGFPGPSFVSGDYYPPAALHASVPRRGLCGRSHTSCGSTAMAHEAQV